MKIIIKARQREKTHDLIKLCAENDGQLVVMDEASRGRAYTEAIKMGVKINSPMTFSNFLNNQIMGGMLVKGFYINNVDALLELLAGKVEIKAITLNKGE